MTKRTAEDLVAEWEKSGVATVNLDELKTLCAENRRLREAGIAELLAEGLGLSVRARNLDAFTEGIRSGTPHLWVTDQYEKDLADWERKARAALTAEPASGEAEGFAQAFREAAITGQAFVKDGRLLKSEDVYALPPPPTQGEEERVLDSELAREAMACIVLQREADREYALARITGALRQRADEAVRRENEACAKIAQEALAKIRAYADDHDDEMVPILIDEAIAAIRARIKP